MNQEQLAVISANAIMMMSDVGAPDPPGVVTPPP
jgi:hypothetical protein